MSLFEEIQMQLQAIIFIVAFLQVVKYMRMFQICSDLIGQFAVACKEVMNFAGFFIVIVVAFAFLYQSL